MKSLITVNDQSITEKDFMQTIDNEIVYLHDTGDVNHVMKTITSLDSVDKVAGHAKAKLLWATDEWWKQNKADENFPDHVESTTTTKAVTVKRYVKVWKYVDDLTIPKEAAQRPMRELVPIASTLAQGYDISKDQWRKINLCANDRQLAEVLQKVKGKQPRKSARVIKLSRDGSLNLWKDNKKKFLGYLNLKEAETDKDIAEAIEKIKVSAGILEE